MKPNKLELYAINGNVPRTYKTTVKGNENATTPLIRRKLTRNIMLAAKDDTPLYNGYILYRYGNLHIVVNQEKHRIVSIRNHNLPCNWFVKDIDKYYELNERLGITELENKLNPTLEVTH